MFDEVSRILLVEDNPGDARLLSGMLTAADEMPCDIVHATRLMEAIALLEKERDAFHAVILDLGLPDSQGMSTIDRTCDSMEDGRLPIIVMTGMLEEQNAIEAVQRGAQEFLIKNDLQPANLVRAVRCAIQRQRTRSSLEEAQTLRRHEDELHALAGISVGGGTAANVGMAGREQPREALSDMFDLLVDQYAALLETAVEERAFERTGKSDQGLHLMAQRLSFLRVRPSDIVQIHSTAVERSLVAMQYRHARVMIEEARLILVEVMEYLADYYYDYSIFGGAPRVRPARHSELAQTGDDAKATAEPKYVLKLFITGRTKRSEAAIRELQTLCENELGDDYALDVIDVLDRPEEAQKAAILATPTVVKELPAPMRKVIGDLDDHERVAIGLELKPW